jgi:DnaJ-class molecular chaperone
MTSVSRYNYYEVLELPLNAPQHEVTTAYDRARKTYSGDNTAIYTIFSENEARELLIVIDEAYLILGNKIMRGIYDQRLRNGNSNLNQLTYESIVEASKQLYPEKPAQIQQKPQFKVDEEFENRIKNEDVWDGAFLAQVREYKNISRDAMAKITKINPYYITAIEQMDASGLPAIVFVRGYVIQLARAMNLDDKKVPDSYMKIFRAKIGK